MLFGLSAVLLVDGLLTKEMAANSTVKGLGRTAANAGWRMILLAVTMYLLVVALAAIFDGMLSNLPGS